MMTRRTWILGCFFLWLVVPFRAGVAVELPEPLWYGTDARGQPEVHLHVFWTVTCPHCRRALPFLSGLEKEYGWLKVHRYELTEKQAHVDLYVAMAKLLGQEAASVPAFLFCDAMTTGFDTAETTGRQLRSDLVACHRGLLRQMPRAAEVPADTVTLPVLGQVRVGEHSLPALTLLIAGLDAFNPCAFFVLLFLLSLLIRGQSRVRMAVIGGLFVFFSGLMYFVFMAAWLNLFLFLEQVAVITFAAGLVAVLMGLINVKDYFYFGQGPTLSIPESAKPRLFQKMRDVVQAGRWPAMVASTVVLAVAANSYELLCTAGFPMVYTRILTLSRLGEAEYYLYLFFYNVVYVVPLLAIVSIFTVTMGARKLGEREGRRLKLLSGVMMLGLGVMLMFYPELLTNLAAALALIGGAVGLTLLLSWPASRAAS